MHFGKVLCINEWCSLLLLGSTILNGRWCWYFIIICKLVFSFVLLPRPGLSLCFLGVSVDKKHRGFTFSSLTSLSVSPSLLFCVWQKLAVRSCPVGTPAKPLSLIKPPSQSIAISVVPAKAPVSMVTAHINGQKAASSETLQTSPINLQTANRAHRTGEMCHSQVSPKHNTSTTPNRDRLFKKLRSDMGCDQEILTSEAAVTIMKKPVNGYKM